MPRKITACIVNGLMMEFANLSNFSPGSSFKADVVIVGSGPAGLMVAREFANTSLSVLVLESGVAEETRNFAALAAVESVGEPASRRQIERRISRHSAQCKFWSHDEQPYGVRCRALGGSAVAWAGKSAAFDAVDFAERPWVPFSGWPITKEELDPYVEQAARALNLGPNIYDESLWSLYSGNQPGPQLKEHGLRDIFWQFARSRIDKLDVMRFGDEFLKSRQPNVRLLFNATVVGIRLDADCRRFQELVVSTFEGERFLVEGRVAVLAASAIENARLLMASRDQLAPGVGNGRDRVGRFLMDHAFATVGTIDKQSLRPILRRFGFIGIRYGHRTHMLMPGLSPVAAVQKDEELLNAALYFIPERAPDDPFDALKRLLRLRSPNKLQDVASLVMGAEIFGEGLAIKALASPWVPAAVKEIAVNAAIRLVPNRVAADFQTGCVPHKVVSVAVEVISEQRPDPDSRITLSDRVDRFGVPLPLIAWRIHDDERRTIRRLVQMTREAFLCEGLPELLLEDWVEKAQQGDSAIIDMGHSLGTTRMSDDPALGVVDRTCQVHGVRGLFVAGGSVFPTSGHANPTLMIAAFSMRLASSIKEHLSRELQAVHVDGSQLGSEKMAT